MQHAICYISTATSEFNNQEIENLLAEWREKNSNREIKGILLFSEGHFFQVLEGEKVKVLALYYRIIDDPRHTNVIQVMGKDVSRGSLDDYVVEHLKAPGFSRPYLIRKYCESVKGMDPQTQQQIREILDSFIDTRSL
ncbi:BLUF domain-containing protein [Salinimicrobium sp. TH3]|uniref:BLUF domain-containing protein n=1 Tax=Salinimicrobium sp. TH3 TaxID=2997342 RepID=UPI002272EF67|nr:BLUF domain-containing protein [Salinimicrobium sp. TH3]MCY2686482.1 BLUF domain-containing protein [Salinimicrobium sp. TH3]